MKLEDKVIIEKKFLLTTLLFDIFMKYSHVTGLKFINTLLNFKGKNVFGKNCPNLNLVQAAERERI